MRRGRLLYTDYGIVRAHLSMCNMPHSFCACFSPGETRSSVGWPPGKAFIPGATQLRQFFPGATQKRNFSPGQPREIHSAVVQKKWRPFLDEFPKHIIRCIAENLPENKDRRALSECCREFRKLIWNQKTPALDCRISRGHLKWTMDEGNTWGPGYTVLHPERLDGNAYSERRKVPSFEKLERLLEHFKLESITINEQYETEDQLYPTSPRLQHLDRLRAIADKYLTTPLLNPIVYWHVSIRFSGQSEQKVVEILRHFIRGGYGGRVEVRYYRRVQYILDMIQRNFGDVRETGHYLKIFNEPPFYEVHVRKATNIQPL